MARPHPPDLVEDPRPQPRIQVPPDPIDADEERASHTGGAPLGTMRAAVRDRFGPPDVVEVRQVARPTVARDRILVRVRASSVNRAEWYAVVGKPYVGRAAMGFFKPKSVLIGADFAGTVEAVGEDVTKFEPGDDVFGGTVGAFDEYVTVRESLARMPANLTFEEAAALPMAAITALQALRKGGDLEGKRVLVNGSSGGVGTFTVQIAKTMGAEVTAVCSTRNVEMARSLGADHVIDYTQEDFTTSGKEFDLMVDVAGSKPWRACKRVLAHDATVVIVGAPGKNPIFGPLNHVIAMSFGAWRSSQKVLFFIAQFNGPDFEHIRQLCESGEVRPVVERSYPLDEIAEALRYIGEGHARGKVVITV